MLKRSAFFVFFGFFALEFLDVFIDFPPSYKRNHNKLSSYICHTSLIYQGVFSPKGPASYVNCF